MLTLVCGFPHAGKTTYSKQFNNVLHLDICGRYSGVKQRISNITDDVVVDGVYDKAEYRIELIKAYKGIGARCIWLNTPKDIRAQRQGYRERKNECFEPPTYSEGWDEIEVING